MPGQYAKEASRSPKSTCIETFRALKCIPVNEGKMGTKYESGRRLEYIVRNKLRERGFVVVRSAGSKGPLDLVAWKGNDIRFIQCKRTKIKELTADSICVMFKDDLFKMRWLDAPTLAKLQLWISSPHEGLIVYNVLPGGIQPQTV